MYLLPVMLANSVGTKVDSLLSASVLLVRDTATIFSSFSLLLCTFMNAWFASFHVFLA